MPDAPTITAEPILVPPADAARLLGISRSTLDQLEAKGLLGPRAIRLGSSKIKLYSVAELKEWAAAGCPGRPQWVARMQQHRERGAA